jgi:hypothetical protein
MTNYLLRGCVSKRRYVTRKDARKAAARLERRDRTGVHVSAYRCGLCMCYHIGHNDVHRVNSVWDYMPGNKLSTVRSVA